MLLLAYRHPAIVVVVTVAHTPQAECAMEQYMLVSVSIETMGEMNAIVRTAIRVISDRNTEVEVVTVIIALPDAHSPGTAYHVYRAIEVVTFHELAVLSVAQHIHQVLITYIEQIVVIVNGIIVSEHHIVYHLIDLIEEVEVDFIHIVVLAVRESEFVSHTIGQEACFATDIAQTHCHTLYTDSCQGYPH